MMMENATNASLLHHSESPPHRTTTAIITLSFFMILIIVLSTCGNFLLILAFARNEQLRASFANKLIMSLAIADFLTAAFPLSYQVSTVIDVDLISDGGLLCTVGGLATYTLFFVSVLTMVMLSIDRFIALGFPLQYSIRMTSRVRRFMIGYPWVHSALFFIFSFFFTKVKFDKETLACGFPWEKNTLALNLYLLFFYFVIPFILLVGLCSWTMYLVRSQNKEILNQTRICPEDESTNSQSRLKEIKKASEIRLAKVSIAIVSIFLFSWSPYVVTRALIAFAGERYPANVITGTAIVVYISLFSNPIIYSSLRADLRHQICRI